MCLQELNHYGYVVENGGILEFQFDGQHMRQFMLNILKEAESLSFNAIYERVNESYKNFFTK